jgi:hypothetical protein
MKQIQQILQIVMLFGMVMNSAFCPGGFTTLNGRLVRINPNGMAKGMWLDVAF